MTAEVAGDRRRERRDGAGGAARGRGAGALPGQARLPRRSTAVRRGCPRQLRAALRPAGAGGGPPLDRPAAFSPKRRENGLWSRQRPDERGQTPPSTSKSRQAMESETLAAAQQIDFSLLALFLRATFTVKIVMVVLIAASFWSWAIIVQKLIDLRRARDEARAFDAGVLVGRAARHRLRPGRARPRRLGRPHLRRRHDRVAALAPQGRRADRGHPGAHRAGDERGDRARGGRPEPRADLSRDRRARSRPSSGSSARSGASSAPSRRSRCSSRPTSRWWRRASPRRCSPPGWGCSAAIPAVIFYNKLNQDSEAIVGGYESFADEFAMILSRQLDRAA